jgi:ribonuclease HII
MKYPNFFFERKLWEKSYKNVAGVDEVGRGCFAGPVVAGCVIFDKNISIPKDITINDSKKLTPLQRIKADKWIRDNAITWGIGEAKTTSVNKIGIGKAARKAFRMAIRKTRLKLGKPIDYLIIDAFYISYVPALPAKRKRRQLAIVKGDTKSLTIGAASIIAKVYRDRLMDKLSKKYPEYAWDENKGYGTKKHQAAILKYGITRYHRKTFVDTWISKRT